ncbi:MAG: hypothetical protein WCK17_12005, partial [Verrucomicrobiota bacterium]
MTLIEDFLSLLGGCFAFFMANNRGGFGITLFVGIAFAAFCWWGCSAYSRLWNLRYRVTFTHHILCALAAILTLASTLVFAALRYTKEAADVSVQVWEVQINLDRFWADTTFSTAYYKVKALGLEDFSNAPPPGSPGGSHIPVTQNGSQLLAASIYANAAAAHFGTARPFLGKIIHAKAELPSALLDADVKNYFATVSSSYPPARGISLVSQEMKRQLDVQVPRVIPVFRSIAIALFFLVQLVPFGLVG